MKRVLLITILFFLPKFIFSQDKKESMSSKKSVYIENLTIEKINKGFLQIFFKSEQLESNKWYWKSWGGGADFDVIAMSADSVNVSELSISAKIDTSFIGQIDIFVFTAAILNDRNYSSDMVVWVKKNYDNHMATKQIGNVKLTMYAPSLEYRKLNFESVNLN